MYALLVFLLCFFVGVAIGYFIGVRRRNIVANLRMEEINEMIDRMTDLESYFRDVEVMMSEVDEVANKKG